MQGWGVLVFSTIVVFLTMKWFLKPRH
jgi:hypothetical protein